MPTNADNLRHMQKLVAMPASEFINLEPAQQAHLLASSFNCMYPDHKGCSQAPSYWLKQEAIVREKAQERFIVAWTRGPISIANQMIEGEVA